MAAFRLGELLYGVAEHGPGHGLVPGLKEGDKERLQSFRGVVIQICGSTPYTKTFTIRKVSNGVGVERIFPYESPAIDKIELNKVGKVRRARIFYLRNLSGKKARIKEAKRVVKDAPAE